MKIGPYEIANKWLAVGGAILAGILVLAIISIPSCSKPPDTTAAIAAMKVELEKQYQSQITEKDTQITDYKSRLTLSEGKYKVLVSQYVDLERRKKDVKPPTTNKELRNRFTALGYPPLASK
jgi:hypothetical protein